MSVRTTISLPDELKVQMDAVEEPVNWSGEAAKCFQKLLGEIAAKKKAKDMSDVVARLKASKITFEEGRQKIGFKAGRLWAEEKASYNELCRAVDFFSQHLSSWGQNWAEGEAAIHAAYAIDEDSLVDEPCWAHAESIWGDWIGVESEFYEDDSFVKGFLEGAKAVLEAVEPCL